MARKASLDAVRVHNRAMVLDALRRAHSPLSRTELAAATGLSVATLSSIAAEMLGEGLIAPAAAAGSPGRGRPQAPLRPNGARASTLALLVSAGGVRLRLCDYAGETLAEGACPPLPPDGGAEALVSALGDRIAAFLETAPPAAPLSAVAVAFQGVVDRAGQRLLWSPVVAPRWVELAAPLAQRFGVAVVVLNDCSAMAEALLWLRPDLGPDFAVILLGAGVGMGLALEGRVFEGRGLSALEFGHLTHLPGGARCRCGRRGCVEAYVADYALARAADRPGADIAALLAAAEAGDDAATGAFFEAGAALGYGVARVFALFGPIPVVLTGPGTAGFPRMEAAFRVALTDGLAAELSAAPAVTLVPQADALALEGAARHARARLDAGFAARLAAGVPA